MYCQDDATFNDKDDKAEPSMTVSFSKTALSTKRTMQVLVVNVLPYIDSREQGRLFVSVKYLASHLSGNSRNCLQSNDIHG